MRTRNARIGVIDNRVVSVSRIRTWSIETRVGFFKRICDLLEGANIAAKRNSGARG
jgi:hypothetical protein